jgi:hypothetical protein
MQKSCAQLGNQRAQLSFWAAFQKGLTLKGSVYYNKEKGI